MQLLALKQGLKGAGNDQQQFSVLQIREMAALARSIKTENGALILLEAGRTETIAQDGSRLVKRPGYEILMGATR